MGKTSCSMFWRDDEPRRAAPGNESARFVLELLLVRCAAVAIKNSPYAWELCWKDNVERRVSSMAANS